MIQSRVNGAAQDLIRWLQDARMRTWVFLVGSNLAVMGLSFAATVVMTHRMSQSDYGAVTLGTSVAAIVALVTRLGADRLLVRDILQHPNQENDYVMTSYFLRGIASLLSLVAVVVITQSKIIAPDWPLNVVVVFVLFGCLSGLLPLEIYDAHGRMRQSGVIFFWTNALYVLGVFVLLFLGPLVFHQAIYVAWIRLGSVVLGLVVQIGFARHFVSLLPWAQIKRMLPLIAATYVGVALPSIGSTIMVQYPSIHLASVQGTAAVAPYGIAMLLASVLALVFLQLGRVLNPDLVRIVRPTATRGVVARFTAKYLAVTISSSAILCGIAYFAAPLVFDLFFPPTYSSGILVFRILLAWVMIGTVISYPILQVLFSLGDHRTFAVAVGVGVTASILLSNVFKAGNGPSGAALVLLLSNTLLVLVASLGLLTRLLRMPVRSLGTATSEADGT